MIPSLKYQRLRSHMVLKRGLYSFFTHRASNTFNSISHKNMGRNGRKVVTDGYLHFPNVGNDSGVHQITGVSQRWRREQYS